MRRRPPPRRRPSGPPRAAFRVDGSAEARRVGPQRGDPPSPRVVTREWGTPARRSLSRREFPRGPRGGQALGRKIPTRPSALDRARRRERRRAGAGRQKDPPPATPDPIQTSGEESTRPSGPGDGSCRRRAAGGRIKRHGRVPAPVRSSIPFGKAGSGSVDRAFQRAAPAPSGKGGRETTFPK